MEERLEWRECECTGETGRSANEAESMRLCLVNGLAVNGLGCVVGFTSGCAVASNIQLGLRSGARRSSWRGDAGEYVHAAIVSGMMGLDISSGLSFLAKRRNMDGFLNNGGGCVVSMASMVSNVM